jgi:hypothetical protein
MLALPSRTVVRARGTNGEHNRNAREKVNYE